LLFVSGLIWLVLGLLLALISSIKLHAPGLFSNVSWLTFGRVRPAAMNAILYGFASQTGLGVLLWMLCRLGRTRLVFQNTLAMAVGFWNLGVTLGILGILAGDSTGFEWLEMPRYASPLLFVAYGLIGICAMAAFYFRRESTLYVSQWYLLAALFWFPWIYSAANLLLIFFPVRGVVQSIVDAWYTSNFLGLWLTPIALAAIFYFIPKLTQRPLYSQPLAAFGFWTLAFFGNWSGSAKLAGGPVPAWIGSVGIAANLLLLVPLIAAAMNWHLTLDGLYGKAKSDLTLRFIVFGAASYIVAILINIVLSLREVSAITHLTYVETAQTQLALFGFVSMTLFGCLNYIVPRVVAEWPSAKMVQAHFWCSAIGIGLVCLALTVGGLLQAFGINNLAVPFVDVIRSTVPFIGLATLGQLVLLVGQAALLWNLILLVRRRFEPLCKSVTDLVMPGRQEVRP
jgi:cytochrome c oxidase cbb3-type subunit 1